MRLNQLFTAIASLMLASCGGRMEVSIPEDSARLELRACGDAIPDEGAQCGTLSVPEDRAVAGGRVLELPVLVLLAKSPDPGADPVIVLGGGPGNPVVAAFAGMPPAFLAEHPLRQHRDLIVMDQRGTSPPANDSLDCPELAKDYAAGERFQSVAEVAAAAALCRERLTATGIDLRQYDSATSAADLDDLRRLLGRAHRFQRWHVVGTSYGSRLALTYADRYPAAVSTLTLDGPLPPNVNALHDASVLEAMDRLLASCVVDQGCEFVHPALRDRFQAVTTQLLAHPAQLANGGSVTGPAVLGTLRALLAAGQGDTALMTMEFVAQGRFDELDAMLGVSSWIDLVPNPSGMYTAVMCQDEAGHPTAAGRLPEQGRGWSDTLRVAAATHSNFALSAAVCPSWLSGRAPTPAPKAVRFLGPTLVTVGQWDPLTPVGNADRIRASMPQTRVVTLAHRGHGLLESDLCVAQVAAAFMRGPSLPVEAACVDLPAVRRSAP